jgi:hypothetical protein
MRVVFWLAFGENNSVRPLSAWGLLVGPKGDIVGSETGLGSHLVKTTVLSARYQLGLCWFVQKVTSWVLKLALV